jgi:hypothetical protein
MPKAQRPARTERQTSTEYTESKSNRETEKQRNRDSNEKNEMKDSPPLAACVRTLQEAVQISLKNGLNKNSLFTFSRALKAFEITNQYRLAPTQLGDAFSLWWNTAKPQLPGDADFDEWRFAFENTFAKTRMPLDANPLDEAIRRADSKPKPAQASRYESPRLKRLVAVCYHLQVMARDGAFFLGVRDAASILGSKNLLDASAMLGGLVRDGILIEVKRGTPGGKTATRFRFNGQKSDAPADPM